MKEIYKKIAWINFKQRFMIGVLICLVLLILGSNDSSMFSFDFEDLYFLVFFVVFGIFGFCCCFPYLTGLYMLRFMRSMKRYKISKKELAADMVNALDIGDGTAGVGDKYIVIYAIFPNVIPLDYLVWAKGIDTAPNGNIKAGNTVSAGRIVLYDRYKSKSYIFLPMGKRSRYEIDVIVSKAPHIIRGNSDALESRAKYNFDDMVIEVREKKK